MATARAFRGYRFPAEVILWAVRWYLRFPVSYRDLEHMLADRGVAVDHVSLFRWVQRFAPELGERGSCPTVAVPFSALPIGSTSRFVRQSTLGFLGVGRHAEQAGVLVRGRELPA